MRRPQLMDKYGCSVSGLRMIFNARPDLILDFFLRLSGSKDEMESLVIQGRALAECPGSIPATKVRTILPLPVILGVIDVWVAVQVHEVVDRYAARILPSTSMSPYLECAKRHRQTMDAALRCLWSLKKEWTITPEDGSASRT